MKNIVISAIIQTLSTSIASRITILQQMPESALKKHLIIVSVSYCSKRFKFLILFYLDLSRRSRVLKRLLKPCSVNIYKLNENDLLKNNVSSSFFLLHIVLSFLKYYFSNLKLSKESLAFLNKIKNNKNSKSKQNSKEENRVIKKQQPPQSPLLSSPSKYSIFKPKMLEKKIQLPIKKLNANEMKKAISQKLDKSAITEMKNKALVRSASIPFVRQLATIKPQHPKTGIIQQQQVPQQKIGLAQQKELMQQQQQYKMRIIQQQQAQQKPGVVQHDPRRSLPNTLPRPILSNHHQTSTIINHQENSLIKLDLLKEKCRAAFPSAPTTPNTFALVANPNLGIFSKKVTSPIPRITSVTSLASPNENFKMASSNRNIINFKPVISSNDQLKPGIYLINNKQNISQQQQAQKREANYKAFIEKQKIRENSNLRNILNQNNNNNGKNKSIIEVIDLTDDDH